MVKVIEGEGKTQSVRLQAYEGVVIARSGGGINESFTVRKISYGEGVERVFPIYSPSSPRSRFCAAARFVAQALLSPRPSRQSGPHFERTDVRARRLNAQWKGFKKPKGEPEDLTRIKGIDVDLQTRLKQLNCYKYEQIANLSDEDISNIDETLKLDGRIERDNWIKQAQDLVAEAAAAEVPPKLKLADPGPSIQRTCKRRRLLAAAVLCFQSDANV